MQRIDRREKKKGGGRPNRGGGRFNKRGGGHGGGGEGGSSAGGRGRGRGAGRGSFSAGSQRGGAQGGAQGATVGGKCSGSKKGNDLDLEDLAFGPVVNDPSKNPDGNGRGGASSGRGRGRLKVSMQTLFMSRENQEMVRETLQFLQMENFHGNNNGAFGYGYDPNDEPEYDELDYRAEDQYWITDRTLIVEDAQVNDRSRPGPPGATAQVSTQENTFAIKKLQRCGFSRALCEEALQITDGDTGAALEYLLNDLYNITLIPQRPSNEDTEESASTLEPREDEKVALESIFESDFEERIPNRCWVLNLQLDELMQVVGERSRQNPDERTHKQEDSKKRKQLCHFYLKGSCKFKDKCRLSHSLPVGEGGRIGDLTHPIYNTLKEVTGEDKKLPYSIEIRFPDGSLYPYEAPLVSFSALGDEIPAHSRLNISKYIMSVARESALDGLPCVFSLVSALECKQKLVELLDLPPPDICKPVSGEPPTAQVRSLTLNGHKAEQCGQQGATNSKGVTKNDISKGQPNGHNGTAPKSTSAKPKASHFSPKKKKEFVLRMPKAHELRKHNQTLIDEFKRKQSSNLHYSKMQMARQKLPAWDLKEQVMELISHNQVVVISGMTGCGKTTQVPQFLLDESLSKGGAESVRNIICTQPRRISATAVAQRVSDERAEKIGRSVGYQIRLESVTSQFTRLLFCTYGIILRRLESDPCLEGVSHIIIDEVHERSEESDFLLMILRNLLDERPDLKVILMSATVNAELFSEYFDECPSIEIPGRAFPVQDFFLEDVVEFVNYRLDDQSPYTKSKRGKTPGMERNKLASSGLELFAEDLDEELSAARCPAEAAGDRVPDMKLNPKQLKMRYPDVGQSALKTLGMMDLEKINYELILELLEWITTGKHEFPRNGAVLIFMPGYAEIQVMYDELQKSAEFGIRNKAKYAIVPLHSTLSSEDQNIVFSKPPPGVTKIVIATNIAETSITIDDVVYVIDSGRMKERKFDQAKSMESLETAWVTRANAMQRRGRAGRVQKGVCFHLFTSHHFDHFLREQPIPEIQRACLEQLVLTIKMLPVFEGLDIEEVLADLIEPPSAEAARGAVKRLQDLGALDSLDMELTPLGYHVGCLPVDVRIGKLILYGAIFRCLDSALTIAACLNFKTPFVTPFGSKAEADKKRREFAMGNSDYLTMLHAYKGYTEIRSKTNHHFTYMYCRENFLSIKTLNMLGSLKQQYVELLSDIGFIRPGIRLSDIERAGRSNVTDGVAEITGLEANINSNNWKVISGMLVAALFPNIVQILTPDTRYAASSSGAVVRPPMAEELRFKTKLDGFVNIHPTSVNFDIGHFASPYLVYHEKVKTSKVYVRDSSMVSVYPLLLFGGGSMSVDLYQGHFILSVDDGWISFKAHTPQIAELVKDLRSELDQLLSDKISRPEMDLLTCPRGSKIINCIVKLITTQ